MVTGWDASKVGLRMKLRNERKTAVKNVVTRRNRIGEFPYIRIYINVDFYK